MRTRYRVSLCFEAQEVAVFDPVLLQELIRLRCAGAEKDEEDAAALTVVFEHAFRERRPVCVAVTDDAVKVHIVEHRQRRIARIHPADVRSERAAESFRIVSVEEIVHLLQIGAELRPIRVGREHQGRATRPSADHLCRQHLRRERSSSVVAQESPERRHT